MTLAPEELRSRVHYDPDTGVFTWLPPAKGVRAGSVAGTINAAGYRIFMVSGRLYYAHRLAWLYVHGRWPVDQIDHINLDKSDNRIANLREARPHENSGNQRSSRGAGLKGIRLRNGRWAASIKVNYRSIHLGTFFNQRQARAAYVAAARKRFGEFARFN